LVVWTRKSRYINLDRVERAAVWKWVGNPTDLAIQADAQHALLVLD
jgi:hypothetical protein